MAGADLRGLKLLSAYFKDAALRGDAEFSRAQLSSADFSDADLTHACLARAVLEGILCLDAYFDHGDLREANLDGAPGIPCVVPGSGSLGFQPEGANLEEADFTGAKLEGVKLGGDQLGAPPCSDGPIFRGADLQVSSLDTIYEGAIYDDRTRFPLDFDPEANSLICWNSDSNGVNTKSAVPPL